MPDAKWTPGPWVSIRGRMGMLIQTEDRCLPVAELGAISVSPETEANARLIAAAPELFEALRGLLPGPDAGWWCRHCVAETESTYDERCTTCGEPFDDPGDEVEAVRVARAALAKAEGGTDDQ